MLHHGCFSIIGSVLCCYCSCWYCCLYACLCVCSSRNYLYDTQEKPFSKSEATATVKQNRFSYPWRIFLLSLSSHLLASSFKTCQTHIRFYSISSTCLPHEGFAWHTHDAAFVRRRNKRRLESRRGLLWSTSELAAARTNTTQLPVDRVCLVDDFPFSLPTFGHVVVLCFSLCCRHHRRYRCCCWCCSRVLTHTHASVTTWSLIKIGLPRLCGWHRFSIVLVLAMTLPIGHLLK